MTAKEMMEESRDTMTVRQAIDLMNERQCHPLGFHLAIVREDMLEKADMFGGDSDGDTPHDLMAQTYDWRWGGQPKRGEYTVKLTAGNRPAHKRNRQQCPALLQLPCRQLPQSRGGATPPFRTR